MTPTTTPVPSRPWARTRSARAAASPSVVALPTWTTAGSIGRTARTQENAATASSAAGSTAPRTRARGSSTPSTITPTSFSLASCSGPSVQQSMYTSSLPSAARGGSAGNERADRRGAKSRRGDAQPAAHLRVELLAGRRSSRKREPVHCVWRQWRSHGRGSRGAHGRERDDRNDGREGMHLSSISSRSRSTPKCRWTDAAGRGVCSSSRNRPRNAASWGLRTRATAGS